MSWPLGYGRPGLRFEAAPDGTIRIDGADVTEPNGWLDVTLPTTATVRGTPTDLTIRLRLVPDEAGQAFFYGEQIEVAGRRHNSMHAMMLAEGTNWVGPLIRAIHDEIIRRATVARVSRPQPRQIATTRSMRVVRPPVSMRSPDDTWEPVAATGTEARTRELP
jgi:hypothetical protein